MKSITAGKVNITDAFCRVEHNEAWLYNMHISPFDQGNRFNVEPVHKRKLLLHAWQIEELRVKMEGVLPDLKSETSRRFYSRRNIFRSDEQRSGAM